jgi:hypothetical protein
MAAQVFAERIGAHYRTALSLPQNGSAPGAVGRETLKGSAFERPGVDFEVFPFPVLYITFVVAACRAIPAMTNNKFLR